MPPKTATEKAMLQDLKHILDTSTLCSTFTCGGRLPILTNPNTNTDGNLTPRTEEKVQEQRILTKGPTIRWGEDGQGRVLTLPASDEASHEALEALIKACEPATFGRGGEDVYDESYRLAGAMATSNFITDFCPYEAGIIDIVAQMLLPPIVGDLQPVPERSKFARRHNLTRAQETALYRAFHANSGMTRRDEVHVANISRALEQLHVEPSSEEEMSQIIEKLDPLGTRWVCEGDFLDLAVERMKMRDGAETVSLAFQGEREWRKKKLARGLRAELYKLNVYSGPEGRFRAHVDTPRSGTQVGSLVVCLPIAFEGGALTVRHQKEEVEYPFSSAAAPDATPAIEWAAFYSDCTHEVLPVLAGNRLTLTYNLFLSSGPGFLTTQPTSLDPALLPLATNLKKMLANPDFLPQGGYLGFNLAHAYPHTNERAIHFIPDMLKGVDMSLYLSLTHLCLPAIFCHVSATGTPEPGLLESVDRMASTSPDPDVVTVVPPEQEPMVRNWLGAFDTFHADTANGGTYRDEDNARECAAEYYLSDDDDYGSVDTDSSEADAPKELREWIQRFRDAKRIVWVNRQSQSGMELSGAGLVYGNESELSIRYARAAIVVKVGEAEKRLV